MALALCAAASIANAQLTEGFPVDTARIIGPDYSDVGGLRVAFAPGDSLGIIVWGKKASRILSDGTILDSIPIFVGVLDQGPGQGVAGAGGNFVTAFPECCGLESDTTRLVAVHISRSGQVLGRAVIDSLSYRCGVSALATDGEGYLLAWDARRYDSSAALCTRLDATGRPLDSAPTHISKVGATTYDIDIARGDSLYLVIWQQQEPGRPYEVLARLLRRDGSPASPDPIRISKSELPEDVAVTFDGHNFVVMWCDVQQWLRIGRISQSGQLLDPGGVLVAEDRREYHDICAVDGVTLATWVKYSQDTGFVRACRYDSALVPLDTAPVNVSPLVAMHSAYTVPSYVAVASTGGTFFVAWSHPWPWLYDPSVPYRSSDAVFRRLSVDGRLLDTACTIVSNAANAQVNPSVASDGRDFLVAWTDYRPTTPEIYQVRGAIVGADRRPLTRGFAIGPAKSDLTCAAYGGGCYLVVWNDSIDGVEGARVSPDGVVLDSVPIRVATGRMYPRDLEYGGGVFLLLLCDDNSGPLAVRIAPDGQLLDSVPVNLALGPAVHLYSRVASDGHGFMVLSYLYGSGDYVFVLVDSLGRLRSTQEDTVVEHASQSGRVTFGGGQYLVSSRLDQTNWRVTPTGGMLDSAGIESPLRSMAASGFDGTDFLLASNGRDGRVRGMRIGPDGTLRDSVPTVLVENTDLMHPGGMCADSFGRVCLAYEVNSGIPYQTTRVSAAIFAMPSAVREGAEQHGGGLVVSPNPATRTLTLDFVGACASPTRVELFDAAGRRVRSLPVAAGVRESHLDIDVRGLPGGVYFVVAQTESGRSTTKVVVQH